MTGKITGTGSYAPAKILDNQKISMLVETSDEWIRERTGVVRRHIAEEDTTASMAAKAAKRAIENAGIQAEEIDLLIVSTLSSDESIPCTACVVQKEVGAWNATCFDMNAACTGFLFAYNMAQASISAGTSSKALIIGSETLSNIVDWTDRATCILFGDGAGAAVLEAVEGAGYPMVTHSDGRKGDALTCKNLCGTNYTELLKDRSAYVRMNGQEIFKFAVRKVPEVILEVLKRAGLEVNDIDLFVIHQANKRIVTAVAKRLQADIDKFPMNLMEYGNTSSASIPLLLDELHRNGRLKRGQKIVMAGFGGGLSWGASILEW